jgi:hypothetical protein
MFNRINTLGIRHNSSFTVMLRLKPRNIYG